MAAGTRRSGSAAGDRGEVHDQHGAAAAARNGRRHLDRQEPLRLRPLPERWRLGPGDLDRRQVTEAKYMINMALLRPHGMAGVTLTAKNHFGSVHFPNDGGWSPQILHNSVLRTQPMGSYNALVDLIGHRHLGGKTMLYILDGLYTAEVA